MKLNGKVMVAVVMMVGALGATGCNAVAQQNDGAPAEQGDATVAAATNWFGVQFAPPAPPPLRVEYPGNPPSNRHFWVNGHWAWNGTEYVWVGGHWDVRRDGYVFVQPHWDNVNGRWTHIPGHWARA
jgi:WXXGXW repeat (2 copies)